MLTRAGRRALDRLAYEDAAERFARALEALALADADDEAGPVLLARGDALLRAGEPAAARDAFTAAAQLARRANDAALLGEAALGFAGLGIAIVGLDTETIARLEEALERATDPVLRSRLQARLGVELYYAPDRTRAEALSAEAVATARAAGNGTALASALNARHVALWRPDRLEERLATAADMIAAARETGERHAELQARNWRVADLFELGDMPAFREEAARHARLADELRLPSFQWYTPLWAAVEALLAGRYEEAERLAAEAREQGIRAGDGNAELFADMLLFTGQLERGEFDEVDIGFIENKIANSPAGPAYAASYAWVLAGRGHTDRARATLDHAIANPHAFDANWMSAQAECAEACMVLGDATHAAVLYDRLAPYAGRPATAGRAVTSYGAVDRHLGGLAALLGRRDDAERHLRTAITRNHELGCTVWAEHAERWLADRSAEDGRRPEALDGEVDAERQLPEELRDRRDALDRGACFDAAEHDGDPRDADQRTADQPQHGHPPWHQPRPVRDEPMINPFPTPTTKPGPSTNVHSLTATSDLPTVSSVAESVLPPARSCLRVTSASMQRMPTRMKVHSMIRAATNPRARGSLCRL